MKTVTKRTEPAREVEDVALTCDRCGKPCDDREARGYNVKEAVVMAEWGQSYGTDGGSKERIVFDCCVACFKKIVVPAMIDLGFTMRTEETDW